MCGYFNCCHILRLKLGSVQGNLICNVINVINVINEIIDVLISLILTRDSLTGEYLSAVVSVLCKRLNSPSSSPLSMFAKC